jgi:hypothetical protein
VRFRHEDFTFLCFQNIDTTWTASRP